MVPEPFKVSAPNCPRLPTRSAAAVPNVVTPLPVTVNSLAFAVESPSTLALKVTAAPVIVEFAVKITSLENVTAFPEFEIELPSLMSPVPSLTNVTAPPVVGAPIVSIAEAKLSPPTSEAVNVIEAPEVVTAEEIVRLAPAVKTTDSPEP